MNRPARTLCPLCSALIILVLALVSGGCLPDPTVEAVARQAAPTAEATEGPLMPTALATRPSYPPGELVDYTAQTGDTLDALALRFNTSVVDIRKANPIIPDSATTMPPGMPMKIPIYYRPLWGTAYQSLPDNLYPNGPDQRDFDPVAFVDQHPGWLKNYVDTVSERNRRGGEVIQFVANNYSISPRLLLALAEYQAGALSNPTAPDPSERYPLGKVDYRNEGLYRQLAWAADTLNQGYYNWRSGKQIELINLLDGQLERPDPWQNAASVALQFYFSQTLSGEAYQRAISGAGLAQTYRELFGDPWEKAAVSIPGSLQQPPMRLPFEAGFAWAFTGGPHNAWGDQDGTWAAIDFAPPSVEGGCSPTDLWVTAVADGVIVRNATGIVVLDLDGDGDERTGWVVFYLHLESGTLAPVGRPVKAGDHIGRPSCEGGRSTGTHVHMARKYNGEWVLADGPLAFNLEGWVSRNGSSAYLGTLTRNRQTVSACVCSDQASQIKSSGSATPP